MSIVLDPQEPAINRGIKTVGVGKKGSKALSEALAGEILADLKAGKVSPAAQGAFLAGLLAKGLEPQEKILAEAFAPGVLEEPALLVNALAPTAPEHIVWLCVQLLRGHTLDKASAYDLGQYLMQANEEGDGIRGLVASLLRVRYETDDEYEGLLKAITDTFNPDFTMQTPSGDPIVQIAEPFDGTDHSYMISPLIGRWLQSLGYRAVHMVGKNSGPKFEMNLWGIAQALGQTKAASNADLSQPKPEFGWFVHQSDLSAALDRWVSIRHQTIKRPFLSTLERFVNPCQADLLIASAFHPPYGEKMMTIAERAGFKAIIIVRNGIEGTTAFPLKRPVKMLISVLKDSAYIRHEMTFDVEAELKEVVEVEEKLEHPKAQDNARLIQDYVKHQTSGNKLFDLRVNVTQQGLAQAIQWINEEKKS